MCCTDNWIRGRSPGWLRARELRNSDLIRGSNGRMEVARAQTIIRLCYFLVLEQGANAGTLLLRLFE